jgi:hypothetical protein
MEVMNKQGKGQEEDEKKSYRKIIERGTSKGCK